jgi:replicative DNA helicase
MESLTDTHGKIEWHFLAGLIETPLEKIYEIATKIEPEDFSLSTTRQLYRVITELAEAGEVVDTLQVMLKVQEQKLDISGIDLARLAEVGAMPSEVDAYALQIRKQSRRRRLRSLCELIVGRLEDASNTTEECLNDLTEGAMEIGMTNKTGIVSMKDLVPQVLEELAREREPGQCCGLHDWRRGTDSQTGGIRRGEVWVVGALPGRGKTAFGLQVCAANNTVPTLMFSLEMSAAQDLRRMISIATDTQASFVRDPRFMNPAEWNHLMNQAAELHNWPVFIDETAALRAKELVNRVRLYVRRHKVELIVLDYIQLVQGLGRDFVSV